MNNISVLPSSEQWVSTYNIRSTDMVSINIPLCGTASTQSCRRAHISVITSLYNSRLGPRVSVFYFEIFQNFINTLRVWLNWENNIRIFKLALNNTFDTPANFSSSLNEDRNQVLAMKGMIFNRHLQ
jgi:hypothetical protein